METVLITGCLGTIGQWTVDRLRDTYRVVGIDISSTGVIPDSELTYRQCDLTDHGSTVELITDFEPDMVLHLAAVPGAGNRSRTETFMTNLESTFHVFDGAGRVGADVVWTSSEATYGVTFGDEPRPLAYLPIDEDHPQRAIDGYGLSKIMGERLAEAICDRYGISITSIQPSWVQVPGSYETTQIREQFDIDNPTPSGSLWSYIDVRDVASLIDRAIAAPIEGHERFLAVAEDNYLGIPTADALEAAWGDLLPPIGDLSGEEAAFSTEKANAELGWTPAHTWRTAETAEVPSPEVRR